jgi:flagellar hook assembly protein FlgD
LNAEYHIDSQNPAPLKSTAPGSMTLGGYPNPFNNSISISMNLASDGNYQLAIYDILGRRVKTLLDGFQFAGRQSIIWDGTDDLRSSVASGTYFMRLKGIGGTRSMKLNLLK